MSESGAIDEVQFLMNIQRLLTEGEFVASYKFALLAALADLSVETLTAGADSDADLIIPIDEIARKFIELYWRQAMPFFSSTCGDGEILHQNSNSKKRAEILSFVLELREKSSGSLFLARSGPFWNSYLKKVSATIKDQPLWKLQKIPGRKLEFLYKKPIEKFSNYLVLNQGVATLFRKFHPLIRSLIEEAWIRYIRRLAANQRILGQSMDLEEFLFGSERMGLMAFRPILMDAQEGNCFYCNNRLRDPSSEVDHFVPWAKYATNLAHNFVLAHSSCNNSKRDFLPDLPHLERWMLQNTYQNAYLIESFDGLNLAHDLNASLHITRWASEQAELSNSSVWSAKDVFRPLPSSWKSVIRLEEH